MAFSLDSIPIVGDIYNTVAGDPRGVKAAYDAQIKASKEQQEKMMQFLMGAKGEAQKFYDPINSIFQGAYGTQGIKGPQHPGGTPGMDPLASMYGGR